MKAPFSQEFLPESKKKSEQESEMETKELFRMKSNYREDMLVQGYRFGKGEKAACIAGAVRGNEIQQLYILSLIHI